MQDELNKMYRCRPGKWKMKYGHVIMIDLKKEEDGL